MKYIVLSHQEISGIIPWQNSKQNQRLIQAMDECAKLNVSHFFLIKYKPKPLYSIYLLLKALVHVPFIV